MLNCAPDGEALFAQARWWCDERCAAAQARAPLARAPRGEAMDLRTYGIGAQILRDLGVRRMRLLAHPRRMPSMAGFDLEVTGFHRGWRRAAGARPSRRKAQPRAADAAGPRQGYEQR